MLKVFSALSCLLLLSGCATYAVIGNTVQLKTAVPTPAYSIKSTFKNYDLGKVVLVLAFSGGGTRAAALAYGVLDELKNTTIMVGNKPRRLLDEIDVISSVSGGSITAAYYGLFGDALFDHFEGDFLKFNVSNRLIRGLFNPLRWFSSKGRTELAVTYYNESLFHGATFADLQRSDGPLVLINASDLSHGVRFSFVQEYFDLLCSDMSTYPVARAVTASMAVPLVFNPIVLENYKDCDTSHQALMVSAEKRAEHTPQMAQVIQGLRTYQDKDKRRYIHLVDGGLTDNLGLRAIYEIIEALGGASAFMAMVDKKPVNRFAVISVNASTDSEYRIDASLKQPSLEETISAVTTVQLQRYSTDTLDLMEHSIKKWADDLSTPGGLIQSYFIQSDFSDIVDPATRLFLNRIPTRLSLSNEQVETLIAAGHELLRNNPVYQRLLVDLAEPQEMK